jgi:hypothetical protein
MRKTEQGMGMTDQGMVVEHGNELCGEGEMGKAEQVMEMAEHGTMAQHGWQAALTALISSRDLF